MPFEPAPDLPPLSDDTRRRIACIAASYHRLTGRHLVAPEAEIVAALWSAPAAVLAHGTEADPVFYFGNRTALALFEMDFATLTRTPSRFSAEPLERDERRRLLDSVARDGITESYAGVRISATGRRFEIRNAAVWTVSDGADTIGQAAAFTDWRFLDASGV